MNVFVQFVDSDQLAIRSVFGERQCDEDVWPNQGVVAEDDPRYVTYMSGSAAPQVVTDPAVIARTWRDTEILRVSWLRDRHRDEVEIGDATTITIAQYAELLAYIKALRDWPATPVFPSDESRPIAPDWVASQTQ